LVPGATRSDRRPGSGRVGGGSKTEDPLLLDLEDSGMYWDQFAVHFLLDLLLNVGHTNSGLVILLFDDRLVFIWTQRTAIVILAITILLLEVRFIVGLIVEHIAILPSGVIVVVGRITITAVTASVVLWVHNRTVKKIGRALGKAMQCQAVYACEALDGLRSNTWSGKPGTCGAPL
jgi:hypothetical protein